MTLPSNYFSPLRVWLFVLLVLLTTTSCRFGSRLPPTPEPLMASDTLLNGYETYVVQRGDMIVGIQFPGTINLRQQAELFFPQDGRIARLYVQSGDFVRANTVLAEQKVDDLQLQLTEAEWDLEIVRQKHAMAAEARADAVQLAEQEVKIAELTLASLLTKKLNDPGAVAPEALAKAEQTLTAAQLDVKRLGRADDLTQQKELIVAEVKVRRLQQAIEQSRILAPFDGNVYFITPGGELERLPATAYEPIMRLVDPTSLSIDASVVENEMEQLVETMAVSVTLNYRPEIVLSGTIQQLPFPFGTGGDGFIHIAVPPRDQSKLRMGGAVTVYAEAQRREQVLWLPPQALREVGNAFYAIVSDGESEREVLVQVGLRTEERVEILAGLVENEIVVRK
ncbi:MAG: HlyD family efflux transporter periplasmic adaptor subunit [Caldilineaceae bacterium]|nr:HlyD family efflux transporter periplasmic adaptor subunit [Caldilineaceae bacterium]